MKMTGPKSTLIALVAAAVSVAPVAAVDESSTCLNDETITAEADESISGPVEAGEGVIKINTREILVSVFSAETLEFFFQRECARLVRGLDKNADADHAKADCEALALLEEHKGFGPPQIDAIARDLALATEKPGYWPKTLGESPRFVDLDSCN